MPKTLKDVAVLSYGKSPNEVLVRNSEIAVWGTGGITGFASRPLFSGPFVLVGRKGTIDRPIYVEKDAWVIDTAYAAHAIGSNHSKYLYYFLNTVNLLKFNEASGVPSLSREYLYKMPIPDVHPKVQKKVSDILDIAVACITRTEETLSKLQKIKTGLMQDIFTRGIDSSGKLRPAYEEKPEIYKPSPFGMIPKEWEIKCLKDVVSIVGRIGFRGYTVEDLVPEGRGALSLSPSNINHNKLVFSDNTFISWNKYYESPEIMIEEKDIVFVKTGSTIGKVCIVESQKWKMTINPQMVIFKNNKLDPHFLYYYFCSDYIASQLRTRTEGGATPTISQNILNKFLIFCPTLDEARWIVAPLIKIDSEISNLDAERQKLVQIKHGLMQDLLTGKVEVKAGKDE